MEPLQLQSVQLAPAGRQCSGQCLQHPQAISTKAKPGDPQVADNGNKEVCRGQELTQNLPGKPCLAATSPLTLGNSRISEMSLGNGPVFTVLQKLETLY